MTALAVVLGWPIAHSRSPAMMNAAFAALGIDATMEPWEVAPEPYEALRAAVTELVTKRVLGASVTLPHKIAIATMCHELSADAHAIGAVNCIARDGDRLVGHNTDAGGFVDAIVAAGVDPSAQRIVILGAGGAARAVAYGVRAAIVDVIARRPADVAWTQARPWSELRDCFARADLVVDCTPAGLDPAADAALADALPIEALPPAARVVTLVYHRRTSLLERASARGHSTLDGRAMLVHQGARAFTIWTGRPAPIDVMTRALAESMKIG